MFIILLVVVVVTEKKEMKWNEIKKKSKSSLSLQMVSPNGSHNWPSTKSNSASLTITFNTQSCRSIWLWNRSNSRRGSTPIDISSTIASTLSVRCSNNSHRVTIRSSPSACNCAFRFNNSNMGFSSSQSWYETAGMVAIRLDRRVGALTGPVSTSESDSSTSRASRRSPNSLSISEVEAMDKVSASDSSRSNGKSSNEAGSWSFLVENAFSRACQAGFQEAPHPPHARHAPQSQGDGGGAGGGTEHPLAR